MSDQTPHELPVDWEDQADLQPTIDLGARQLKRQALDSLFARAMAGLLPRYRALKSYEPDILDERHLHAVLLRAGGMTQGAIAKMFDWSDSWCSVVLNHPDAQYVLTRIISFAADNVIDLETRIKATAPEAFDTVVEVMRSTNDEKLRSGNAFEVLRLAGYGVQKKGLDGAVGSIVNNTQNTQINLNAHIPASAINNLADAIRESRQIQDVVYELPPGTGPAPVSDCGDSPASPGESGHLDAGEPPTGGSLAAGPDRELEEKVA